MHAGQQKKRQRKPPKKTKKGQKPKKKTRTREKIAGGMVSRMSL
jgi:hypothetical protein